MTYVEVGRAKVRALQDATTMNTTNQVRAFVRRGVSSQEWLIWQAKSAGSILLYFLLAEFDRVCYEVSMEEARELVNGYTGRSLDATCSSAADAASIKLEIADRVGEVDRTIRVLVSAGMSTSHLREAVDHGVDLERFTCPGIAFNAIVLGLLEVSGSWRKGHGVLLQALRLSEHSMSSNVRLEAFALCSCVCVCVCERQRVRVHIVGGLL